jgi:hypothetical protein
LAEAGLRDVTRIVVHENRTVMVSLSRGVLRIQRGFVYAPDRVLRAVVAFLEPGRGRTRRAAQRELLAFPVHEYVATRPSRRSSPAPRPGDRRLLAALRTLHDALNRRHFAGRLSRPRFRLSDRMRTRLAEVAVRQAGAGVVEIGISRGHLRRDGWDELGRTLLHEMVHQWQVESGLPLDHGAEFRRMAREVGVEPSARRRVARTAARQAAPRRED